MSKQTAVEQLQEYLTLSLGKDRMRLLFNEFEKAKAMEKEKMLDFGEFIIDELEPMAQNREWVEGYPVQFPHKCTECDYTNTFSIEYPYLEYETINL